MKGKSKRQKLAEELAGLCYMVRGSLVHTLRKCGRPGCECAKGRLHPFCYLSRSGKGSRNRILYVKPSEQASFENAIAMYERAWAIIEELSEINIREIKENGIDARRNRCAGGAEALCAEGGDCGDDTEVLQKPKRKDVQGCGGHPRPSDGVGGRAKRSEK